LPNAVLAYRVLDYIGNNLDRWNQDYWKFDGYCGTTYCFAGHTVVMADMVVPTQGDTGQNVHSREDGRYIGHVADVARKLLDITWNDDLKLFHETPNDFKELTRRVEEIFGPRPAEQLELELV
jgi:hypothetical protein